MFSQFDRHLLYLTSLPFLHSSFFFTPQPITFWSTSTGKSLGGLRVSNFNGVNLILVFSAFESAKTHFKEHYFEIRSLLPAPAPGCTWLQASAQLALVDDGTSCRHQVDQVPPPRRPTKTGPAAAGHHLHQQLIHQPSLAANGPRQKCHGGAGRAPS